MHIHSFWLLTAPRKQKPAHQQASPDGTRLAGGSIAAEDGKACLPQGDGLLLGIRAATTEEMTTQRTSSAGARIDPMKRPARVLLMSVVLIGIGSMAGALLERLSFPRVARIFNTCASTKQFIVEFRTDEWHYHYGERTPGLIGKPFPYLPATLEIDGSRIGQIESDVQLRHFLCEGNHQARLIFGDYRGSLQQHVIDFAVSRPSLFHLTEGDYLAKNETGTCVSGNPCIDRRLQLELSAYDPDDVKVRVYPLKSNR
jgi:hypothetical protein